MLKKAELDVLGLMNQNVNHFDNYADAGGGSSNGGGAELVPQKGNPAFAANVSFTSIQKYFTFNTGTGVFTAALFNALPASIVNSAFFLFGTNDFVSGYPKAKNLVPLGGGVSGIYGVPFVYGKDYPVVNFAGVDYPLDANARAVLQVGDVVVPITAITAGPVNNVIFSIMRCQQVSYATLVHANNTNSFLQKGIRMNLNDSSANGLLQFNNAVFNYRVSWLGQFQNDSTDIQSNNKPTDYKTNIVDIPLQMGITKDTGLCSYVNLQGFGAVNNITIQLSNFAGNVQNPQR
jgi:hypothetical protein